MRKRLQTLAARVDALTRRERAILFATAAIVVVVVAQALLLDPLATKRNAALERIVGLQQETEALQRQAQLLIEHRNADPDAENLRMQAELVAALKQLSTRIATTVQGLIEPRQMAEVLEDVLTRNTDLRLIKAESLPALPLTLQQQAGKGTIYRHGLRLELEGSYLGALDYLRALQQMPRSFYWDEIEIVMDKYPRARIIITVHTLSLSEGWIGV